MPAPDPLLLIQRQRLQAWLHRQPAFGEDATIVDLAALAGGQSSELRRLIVRTGGVEQSYVIRLEPRGKQLYLTPDIVREYRIMDGLAGTLPVPPVLAVEREDTILDAPFLIMRQVAGRAPLGRPSMHLDGMLLDLPAQQRRHMAAGGINALARLHAVDWRTSHPFLAADAARANPLDRHLAKLRDWYAWAAQGRPFPITDRALEYLMHEHPRYAAGDTVLLWGDARPGNILFAPDGSIAAMLDWEGAIIGPRSLDVGYWIMMDRFHAEMIRVPRLPGWPSEAQTLADYMAAANAEVTDLDYFIVMAAFFLAVMMIRTADLGVASGRFAAATRLGQDNVLTQTLARSLGLPIPDLSPDFIAHRSLQGVTLR